MSDYSYGRSRYNDDEDTQEPQYGLSVYTPERVQSMGNGGRKELINGMEETITFLKEVGGMSDKEISKLKVAKVGEVKEKITKEMTIGNFKKWVEGGTKPEPVVMRIGRFVKDLISWPFSTVRNSINGGVSETTLSLIFGTITVVMIGILVARMAGIIK